MAGVPLWLVGAVIGVVVLVALLIFVVMIRCLSPWIRCHLTFTYLIFATRLVLVVFNISAF